jgi:hypothetical protein
MLFPVLGREYPILRDFSETVGGALRIWDLQKVVLGDYRPLAAIYPPLLKLLARNLNFNPNASEPSEVKYVSLSYHLCL